MAVSTLWSHFVFGTDLSWEFLVGSTLIVGGAFFFSNPTGGRFLATGMAATAAAAARKQSTGVARCDGNRRTHLLGSVVLASAVITVVNFTWGSALFANQQQYSQWQGTLSLSSTTTDTEDDWNSTSFSYMKCRGETYTGKPPIGCIEKPLLSFHENGNDNTRRELTIDIMSIGSEGNRRMLDAQSRTWASHTSVRFFWGGLEADEADPNCYKSLTKDQMTGISTYCRSFQAKKKYKHSPLMSYLMNNYAGGNYLQEKPPGWFCANKRPGVLFGRLGRLYRKIQSLPDYFIFLDDDGYYNMELFRQFVQDLDPWEPSTYAGCLIQMPLHATNMTFPFGGFGLILSRGTLMNLIRPVHCGATMTDNSNNNLFQEHACSQLQSNMFGEYDSFINGMSVSDLMAAHASRDSYASNNFMEAKYPFCIHGDWMTGYYINYYQLSNKIPNPYFKDRPGFRIRSDLGIVYEANKHANPPRNCLNDRICDSTSQVCHHMSDESMHDLVREARLVVPWMYQNVTERVRDV